MLEIGPFHLDEPARALRLADREIALQPRVFDLLTYLVKNRDRVISKDELLDNLWPGVTVTDNSLQRAVSSLRTALREGGMEDAVKNFPRSGYRFLLDVTDGAKAATDEAPELSALDTARKMFEEQHWSEAIEFYKIADDKELLSAKDLDRLAVAMQCLSDIAGPLPILVRAVNAHSEAGDYDSAAIDAAVLSTLHLERGETAISKGWLARGDDLGAKGGPKARSIALWARARFTAFEAEPKRAEELCSEAYELARESGDLSVQALGLMFRGFYRLSLGDTKAGQADQDHAAAIALSAQLDPVISNLLYCNLLWGCRTFADWSRANQWTAFYEEFQVSRRLEISGSCKLHRAEVLGVQGSLDDALDGIQKSLDQLVNEMPWAVGDGQRVLGDILAAIGDDDAAMEAYDKSYALGWNPEPGRAMLLMERGDTEGAYAALERGLLGQSWWTLQRQGMLLAHLALVAAAAGKTDRAKALIEELAGQEQRWPMPSIRALTNEASALLARRDGKLDDALRHLHLARQLWTSVESRYNAARLRLIVAESQCELGDKTGAATELRIVCPAIEALKSKKLRTKYDQINRKLA